MLYIIGLGLGDAEDITCNGLSAVRKSDLVYLEHYTSILGGGVEYVKELESFYAKSIILADRTMVEQDSDKIIESARDKIVSFLVVGDPFGNIQLSFSYINLSNKGAYNLKRRHNSHRSCPKSCSKRNIL